MKNLQKLDKQILQLNKQSGDYKFDKHPGRKEIRITQWGPYDYLYPILWLTKVDSSGKMFFDILGQKGKWTIKNFKGVKNISSSKGISLLQSQLKKQVIILK